MSDYRLNDFMRALAEAGRHGVAKLAYFDAAMISGEKLTELQDKARKWDAFQVEIQNHPYNPTRKAKRRSDECPNCGALKAYGPVQGIMAKWTCNTEGCNSAGHDQVRRAIGATFSNDLQAPSLNAPIGREARYLPDGHINEHGNLVFRVAPPQPEIVEHKFEIKVEYGEAPIAKALRTGERGPGLASRYPDATKAGKPDEPITVDLSGDWD